LSPGPNPDEIASKLDGLVEPAPEAENAVLTDEARVVRWTGPLFVVFSVILLPWTIYLARSLPDRQVSPHYDAAWAGFDVILLVALATTGYFALRRSRYLATAAAAHGGIAGGRCLVRRHDVAAGSAAGVRTARCRGGASACSSLRVAQLSH
jgi:hypothetical protein